MDFLLLIIIVDLHVKWIAFNPFSAGDQLHLALPFIPVGRLGKRGDIANIVLFASSDGAGFISGETIVADGGTWLSSPNTMDLSRRHLQSVAGPKSKV